MNISTNMRERLVIWHVPLALFLWPALWAGMWIFGVSAFAAQGSFFLSAIFLMLAATPMLVMLYLFAEVSVLVFDRHSRCLVLHRYGLREWSSQRFPLGDISRFTTRRHGPKRARLLFEVPDGMDAGEYFFPPFARVGAPKIDRALETIENWRK